ncbi:unnamed protein product [Trichogramma brassicae]|uniref:Uncharacterized protein n=1 Tax=Trichogramma brassicae TaxID=86971 RepID=A0A6H5HX63_9HYME|nr:unnamed protein product [Trichogramma brassicae]
MKDALLQRLATACLYIYIYVYNDTRGRGRMKLNSKVYPSSMKHSRRTLYFRGAQRVLYIVCIASKTSSAAI